jgi:lipid-A-disaccharide synthase-like uncharacterized protein
MINHGAINTEQAWLWGIGMMGYHLFGQRYLLYFVAYLTKSIPF